MPRAAQDEVFSALASPVRRKMMHLLHRHGGLPVADLAGHFPMTRPSVSEHLRVLKEAGLVSEHRQGRQRIYQVRTDALQELAGWLGPYLPAGSDNR